MFSWLKKEEKVQEVVETALNEMKKIYKKNLLPLEVDKNVKIEIPPIWRSGIVQVEVKIHRRSADHPELLKLIQGQPTRTYLTIKKILFVFNRSTPSSTIFIARSWKIPISMQSRWSSWWDSTQQAKLHSSDTCWRGELETTDESLIGLTFRLL